jgi:hypothetical protein
LESRSRNNYDGTRGEADDLLGDATKQQASQLAAAAAGEQDHVDCILSGDFDEWLGDIAPGRPNVDFG